MSAAIEKETGMLDVGKHCAYCRQLDFLPFHCSFCNEDFCSNHRLKEDHHCRWLLEHEEVHKTEKSPSKSRDGSSSNDEAYFKSLLPERASVRIQRVSEKREPLRGSNTAKVSSTLNSKTLDKIFKFFQRNEKRNSNNKSKKNFGSSSNKIIQLANLKKIAKGDPKIPMQNRIYIWCYFVDGDETDIAKEDTRMPLYINKMWPVGRAMDYLSIQLNVKSSTLTNSSSNDKFQLCKLKEGKQVSFYNIGASLRVTNEIKDLDTLYLVHNNADEKSN
ncbi:ubiquitin-proteasome pathway [Saccharomyces cerevisiae]|nr:ubiquitin-proteasome pathway [Saccharomyces cerevisiae]CAI4744079.1 BDM_1a_G0046000.mRNA.1.CDS.1 [Saccharomyces cerevisiae]CAI7310408.1 BDM_1a_G0046000.mRNA.1.CDS.1 [Saccharomyces cerevisiae]